MKENKNAYKLLDPFVMAYDNSKDFGNTFKEIIKKKMTIDEVKELKFVLTQRQKAFDLMTYGLHIATC